MAPQFAGTLTPRVLTLSTVLAPTKTTEAGTRERIAHNPGCPPNITDRIPLNIETISDIMLQVDSRSIPRQTKRFDRVPSNDMGAAVDIFQKTYRILTRFPYFIIFNK